MPRIGWIALVACLGGCSAASHPADADVAPEEPPPVVLLFTRTTGFRHGSIEPAVRALRDVGAERGWTVEHTEDASVFDDGALARVDVVVFLLTTGDVLDDAQQLALERWVRGGGGWVGVHSASDTEYEWPFYGRLVGAHFARHPAIQTATIHVTDPDHPSTQHLPEPWVREDEWYDFLTDPSADVEVLLTVDEATYSGGGMGAHHPIAWHHTREGGRALYTGLGHTDASWSEPALLAHVAGAIEWAARRGSTAP